MPPIQFSFTLPLLPSGPAQRAAFVADVNRALALVSGHFESFRMIDHLGAVDMESFTTLAYLAAGHPRLKFGHTVICNSFRNPALVAKMGAALQFLSGGRFLLGIGAGWNEPEYTAYGYDFPPAGTRVDQLEEAVQIIRALWTQPQVTFTGRHYRVIEAQCEPAPDPLPPVMIGAFKPRMLRLAAQYADEWNISSTGIGPYRRMVKEFERACAEVGRDPAAMRRSWSGGCICRYSQVDAARIAGGRYSTDPDDDFDFVGTPRQIIDQMRPFIDLGVTSFILDCGGFPNLTTLELLIEEVLPGVRDQS